MSRISSRCEIRRRTTRVLIKWLDELNMFGWPSFFGEPEDRNVRGTPRRNDAMNEILVELGWRLRRKVAAERKSAAKE